MRWIYLLRDPRDYAIRYVGCSQVPEQRLRQHVVAARAGATCPVARWLRRLVARGLEPVLDAVEYVSRKYDHAARERQWIEHLLATGERLLNVQNGGTVRRAARKRVSAGERARRAVVIAHGVSRAVAEFGDRSSAPAAPHEPEPAAPPKPSATLNRFGCYQDAAGRWRTPRGAKPRGRVPARKT